MDVIEIIFEVEQLCRLPLFPMEDSSERCVTFALSNDGSNLYIEEHYDFFNLKSTPYMLKNYLAFGYVIARHNKLMQMDVVSRIRLNDCMKKAYSSRDTEGLPMYTYCVRYQPNQKGPYVQNSRRGVMAVDVQKPRFLELLSVLKVKT